MKSRKNLCSSFFFFLRVISIEFVQKDVLFYLSIIYNLSINFEKYIICQIHKKKNTIKYIILKKWEDALIKIW